MMNPWLANSPFLVVAALALATACAARLDWLAKTAKTLALSLDAKGTGVRTGVMGPLVRTGVMVAMVLMVKTAKLQTSSLVARVTKENRG